MQEKISAWLKENWFKVTIIVLVLFGIWIFFGDRVSETRGRWQAVYYPEGCLTCENNYIWSPFFETVNECINWVHAKVATRKNSLDAAECSFNCQRSDDWPGMLLCDETVDVLGKPSF